ncbi:hypothetical protein [Paenibacillus terrae]|uniref:hypothetical protein n=1 Tax=Paenibacillus terrae TaxID=159743 RepID=UPI0021CCE83F|nr:hypothetical protein [Paenibacillus terrae]
MPASLSDVLRYQYATLNQHDFRSISGCLNSSFVIGKIVKTAILECSRLEFYIFHIVLLQGFVIHFTQSNGFIQFNNDYSAVVAGAIRAIAVQFQF